MPAAPPSRRVPALAMLVLANLFWALSFPVTKAIEDLHERLIPGSSGTFITACTLAPRFLLALAMLAALSLAGKKGAPPITRNELRQGLTMGLLIGTGLLFQIDGLRFTAASTSAFLTQFYAIVIPAWLAFRRRRNPGAVVWICCVLVLAGVAILAHFDLRTFRLGRGELETLVSSIFFMGPIFCLENRAYAGNRSGKITLVMFAVQSAIFTTIMIASAPRAGALPALWVSGAWLAMTLMLAVFCTLGAFWIMSKWQPYITATEAGLIYCLEPVFASILAAFLPALLSARAHIAYGNEKVTLSLVVGGGLVTLANIIIQLRATPEAFPA
jgi:drug/metabolite transporter (DMT)-like permease